MVEILWVIILIFMVGASIFSILNIVIYRVPRHLYFANARSMCPHCGKVLHGWDLVPVLSWIYLKGKCQYCKAPIPLRYPLVELLGGVAAILCIEKYGFTMQSIVVFAFLCMLTVIAFVDQDRMKIPNGFVVAILVIAIASIFLIGELGIMERIIGFFVISVPLLLITLTISGAFGGGDIKLMAAAGLFMGWKLLVVGFFCALLSGSGYGIFLLVFRKKGRKAHFAFGPFLCIGMAIALFMGNELIQCYMRL